MPHVTIFGAQLTATEGRAFAPAGGALEPSLPSRLRSVRVVRALGGELALARGRAEPTVAERTYLLLRQVDIVSGMTDLDTRSATTFVVASEARLTAVEGLGDVLGLRRAVGARGLLSTSDLSYDSSFHNKHSDMIRALLYQSRSLSFYFVLNPCVT